MAETLMECDFPSPTFLVKSCRTASAIKNSLESLNFSDDHCGLKGIFLNKRLARTELVDVTIKIFEIFAYLEFQGVIFLTTINLLKYGKKIF